MRNGRAVRLNCLHWFTTTLLLLSGLSSHANGATLSPLLQPSTNRASGPLQVWVVVLNPGDAPLAYQFPDELAAQLIVGGVAREVTLRRLVTSMPADVTLPPGGFVRQSYVVPLPDRPGKEVGLTLMEAPNQRLSLALTGQEPASGEVPPSATAHSDDADAGWGPRPLREESMALQFFREHFFPHEPMYVVGGWEDPNVKFQISFKYRILNADIDDPGWLVRKAPALANLYFAYTQTSLWDISAPSAPFYDSSYKPEFFYQWLRVDRHQWADWFTMDLQGGLQHASNGQDGLDSRSLNIFYVMPTFYFGNTDKFHVQFAPRVWTYVGSLDDNPDIANYYGYVQLRGMLGWTDGIQLAVMSHIGNGFNRANAQIDLTYPLFQFGGRNLAIYADLQYFIGYGESLLGYNERSSVFRAGISLWR